MNTAHTAANVEAQFVSVVNSECPVLPHSQNCISPHIVTVTGNEN